MKKKSKITHGFHTLLAVLISLLSITGVSEAADTQVWDKTFPKSDKVIHEKVFYPNRYGITIAADLYLPKNIDKSKKYAAILVGTPYGGVKEQGAGIYAQIMAERGFVAIAFDETEDAYKMAFEPKELYIAQGARHIDLYDRTDMIPFDKLTAFFTKALR